MDLSVIIPARSEMFLQNTIDDVLAHIRGDDTEVIVVLDGYWPAKGIPVHERLTVIQRPESIGQRAAVNQAARLSRGRYIMKLDAHCSVDEGFDVKLLEAAEELEPGVMQVPRQYNLHVFDWVCECGKRRYQGPSGPCEDCGGEVEREMVWKRRESRLSMAWRFDRELHFKYWGELKDRLAGEELSETMSLLGACWFVSRERFWEIDGLDEEHGGWGQMGTELACKQWLSGSRVVCNRRTWFAHLFRTQGGDCGFPYELKGSDVEKARKHSRKLWEGGTWAKATRPLSWLIEHFAPVPDWGKSDADSDGHITSSDGHSTNRDDDIADALTKGIVYYSDCRGDETILRAAREQLVQACNGHSIVSVTLAPVDLGDVRVVMASLERGYLTMFRQILAGLEVSRADVVFLAEHDVLYHPSHFDFTPPSNQLVYYNTNVWKVDAESGRALHYICRQTSGLCANRQLLLKHYRKRVELVEAQGFSRRMGFEPGTHGRAERVDDLKSEAWRSSVPNIDIRHRYNLTPSRWKQSEFRNQRNCKGWTEADEVPGWGKMPWLS